MSVWPIIDSNGILNLEANGFKMSRPRKLTPEKILKKKLEDQLKRCSKCPDREGCDCRRNYQTNLNFMPVGGFLDDLIE